MGVAADNRPDALFYRVYVKLRQNVNQVEINFANRNTSLFRQVGSPRRAVVITAHGHDRGNLFQFGQDFRFTYVARVNDKLGIAESGQGLRTDQPVSVGNNAYLPGLQNLLSNF